MHYLGIEIGGTKLQIGVGKGDGVLTGLWRGIVNARNTSGANDTDSTVIATLARRLYDMMATRRINGNLSREEFRAVSVISFLNLAVQYDSPAVVDLKASASSPEMRLQKIGERVHMNCHVKSKPFFDLAHAHAGANPPPPAEEGLPKYDGCSKTWHPLELVP